MNMNTLQIDINGQLIYAPMQSIEANGITNYYDIIRALSIADKDASITRILLMINSNGGMVQGITEVTDMLQSLRDRGVQITTYVTGNCCSAAYHIACISDRIIATTSAIIGSIGACAIIKDGNKIDDDDARLRSKDAVYKCPDLPISDEYRAFVQANIDESGAKFIEYVKAHRNISDDDAFSGKHFKVDKALELNLIDAILPIGELV